MKVIPVASPTLVKDLSTPDAVRTAKAVAAFNKGKSTYDKSSEAPTQGQAQETPVADPNHVSPEELSAIQSSQPVDSITETTDTTTEEVAPPAKEEPKDPALERQFAQLARQERMLRQKAQQQDQAFKAKEAELAAREAQLSSQPTFNEKDYVKRDRLIQDALGVLESEGIATYDQLTQRAINRQPVDPVLQHTIDELRAEITALKQTSEKSQKTYEEQQQTAYQSAIKQITADAKKLIFTNPDEYEAIVKTKSVNDIVELVEKHYKKYGEVLTVEEAAQEVENYLVDEGVSIGTNINKIKQRIQQNAQSAKSPQQTQAKPQQTQVPQMKTLTNATSSSRKLSARERALLAFKGELKG